MTDRSAVRDWLGGYERAWRARGTDALDELFADDLVYLPSPWADAIRGRRALARFWEASRDGPDEGFEMATRVVAVDGDTAVVRIDVAYEDGQRWRDLWLITFDDAGRCVRFEEWPFAPGQDDGHGDDRG
jgi:ketosteroid isomerase-like protein